jgi:uncharacterized protein (DUF1330 family)
MSAYVVSRVNATQWSWLKQYGAATKSLIEKHGGRYLAQGGKAVALEGAEPLPAALVVIEFPDMASAQAWYADPDYQPLKALRQANAEVELSLVDGLS